MTQNWTKTNTTKNEGGTFFKYEKDTINGYVYVVKKILYFRIIYGM